MAVWLQALKNKAWTTPVGGNLTIHWEWERPECTELSEIAPIFEITDAVYTKVDATNQFSTPTPRRLQYRDGGGDQDAGPVPNINVILRVDPEPTERDILRELRLLNDPCVDQA